MDAIVTDPPYGLKFMGKSWDYDVPAQHIWEECLRVLKPGGHLLSFFGTRTYHRGVTKIEDAGFEIRDQIQWIYGSGFPKSLDISKAIDKQAGVEREVIGPNPNSRPNLVHVKAAVLQPRVDAPITTPATPEAKQWQGFGTALKPANEPIVLARKPISEKTVAENVLKWGCGGLNIDVSRVGPNPGYNYPNGPGGNSFSVGKKPDNTRTQSTQSTQGRFPANILFDECAAEMLDEQSGDLSRNPNAKNKIYKTTNANQTALQNSKSIRITDFGDSGGASRFFYCAKASKSERNAGLEGMPEKPMNTYNFSEDGSFTQNATAKSGEQVREARQNFHPTVKPNKTHAIPNQTHHSPKRHGLRSICRFRLYRCGL